MKSRDACLLASVATAVALAALRVAGHTSEAFQAAAHLYMGGVSVAWGMGGGRAYLGIFAALTVVESACFLISRVH